MQSKIIETVAALSTLAAYSQAHEVNHPVHVFATNNCEWKEGKEWNYLPGDEFGTTVNGITYLSLGGQGVRDYSEGPSFIVPSGVNALVFTENFAGDRRAVEGSATFNQCQTLAAEFAARVNKDSTMMLIPDALWALEPEVSQTSMACQIDEAINLGGANRCVDHSECSGGRTCSEYGWCEGTSGCPGACEIDEAINSLGPNQCDSDIQCAGARTCSPHGWCQGDSGCGQDHHRMLANTCSYDEAKNIKGPNQCSTSYECAGARTCSIWGWCQGISGCEDPCAIDEAKNAKGPNRCSFDEECAGERTCSPWGWC